MPAKPTIIAGRGAAAPVGAWPVRSPPPRRFLERRAPCRHPPAPKRCRSAGRYTRRAHEPVQSRLHRLPADPGVPHHRPGARTAGGGDLWGFRADRRLQRGVSHSQPVPPAVRGGRVQPGFCPGAGPLQADRRRSRHPPADRQRRHRAGLVPAGHLRPGCDRRAGAGLDAGQRFQADAAQLRGHGADDALDVPLHRLHVDGGAVGRGAEHLETICRAGLHARAAEPVDDRRAPGWGRRGSLRWA